MPQTITGAHKTNLAISLASKAAMTDLTTIITAKAGTLKGDTQKRLWLLMASVSAAKRVIAIINAGTGTVRADDRQRFICGVGNLGEGQQICNAISGL